MSSGPVEINDGDYAVARKMTNDWTPEQVADMLESTRLSVSFTQMLPFVRQTFIRLCLLFGLVYLEDGNDPHRPRHPKRARAVIITLQIIMRNLLEFCNQCIWFPAESTEGVLNDIKQEGIESLIIRILRTDGNAFGCNQQESRLEFDLLRNLALEILLTLTSLRKQGEGLRPEVTQLLIKAGAIGGVIEVLSAPDTNEIRKCMCEKILENIALMFPTEVSQELEERKL